jgi:hypothetical protein
MMFDSLPARAFPQSFLNQFKDENGLYRPLLDRILKDHTLMLALRGSYVNVYYRGGNLLKLTSDGVAEFDANYLKDGRELPSLPERITTAESLQSWLRAVPHLKDAMDRYFVDAEKLEREFQQIVARENNQSKISNETEYFISDIEYADTGARFDMLAVRWPRRDRRHVDRCRMCLIEMKYGDDAYVGSSGLVEHLEALDAFLCEKAKVDGLRMTMQTQFNQLRDLGLLRVNQSGSITIATERPEVVILLANHHPGKSNLGKILRELADPKFARIVSGANYDLRFFVASLAGYALHEACMLDLSQVTQLVDQLSHRART